MLHFKYKRKSQKHTKNKNKNLKLKPKRYKYFLIKYHFKYNTGLDLGEILYTDFLIQFEHNTEYYSSIISHHVSEDLKDNYRLGALSSGER